jgi:hypothetical protein
MTVGRPRDVDVVKKIKVAESFSGFALDPRRAIAVIVSAVDHGAHEIRVENNERQAKSRRPRDDGILTFFLASAYSVHVFIADGLVFSFNELARVLP